MVLIVRDKDPSRSTLEDRSMVMITFGAATAAAGGGGGGIASSLVAGGGMGIATAMGKSSPSTLYSIGGAVGGLAVVVDVGDEARRGVCGSGALPGLHRKFIKYIICVVARIVFYQLRVLSHLLDCHPTIAIAGGG